MPTLQPPLARRHRQGEAEEAHGGRISGESQGGKRVGGWRQGGYRGTGQECEIDHRVPRAGLCGHEADLAHRLQCVFYLFISAGISRFFSRSISPCADLAFLSRVRVQRPIGPTSTARAGARPTRRRATASASRSRSTSRSSKSATRSSRPTTTRPQPNPPIRTPPRPSVTRSRRSRRRRRSSTRRGNRVNSSPRRTMGRSRRAKSSRRMVVAPLLRLSLRHGRPGAGCS